MYSRVNLEQTISEREMANRTFYQAYYDDVTMEEKYSDIFSIRGIDEKPNQLEMLFNTRNCIYIYTTIVIVAIIVTITRSIAFYKMCMIASVRLHNRMFRKICNAITLFFTTNCHGRILNRFSKDMGSIDETLPNVLVDTIQVSEPYLICHISSYTNNQLFNWFSN